MKRLSLFIYFFLITVLQAAAQQSFDKTAVKSVMKRVADWQIANPNKGAEHDDLDWTHAALYMGMLDWAELTEKEDSDDSYYQWLLRIGQRNHFQIGKWMYHADFIAVGQPFIDLYLKYGNKKMIAPVMARANWVVEIRLKLLWNWITANSKLWTDGPGATHCLWLPPYMPNYMR